MNDEDFSDGFQTRKKVVRFQLAPKGNFLALFFEERSEKGKKKNYKHDKFYKKKLTARSELERV